MNFADYKPKYFSRRDKSDEKSHLNRRKMKILKLTLRIRRATIVAREYNQCSASGIYSSGHKTVSIMYHTLTYFERT